MNLSIHTENKDEVALSRLIAEIHAEAVLRYVAGLPCSREQKLKLIEKIIKSR